MSNTYDLKTIRKTYSVIRNSVSKLEKQSNGFLKEARRYKKNGDAINASKAHETAIGIIDTIKQISAVKEKLKSEFKGKTKK